MNMTFAVLGLSGGELVLVLVVILILFGAKKIPEFAKGLGKGINEFKKASNEVTSEIQNAMDTPVQTSKPTTPAPQAAPVQPATTQPSQSGQAGPTVTKV
jgi:sec-independent protein translocase protein TatA